MGYALKNHTIRMTKMGYLIIQIFDRQHRVQCAVQKQGWDTFLVEAERQRRLRHLGGPEGLEKHSGVFYIEASLNMGAPKYGVPYLGVPLYRGAPICGLPDMGVPLYTGRSCQYHSYQFAPI